MVNLMFEYHDHQEKQHLGMDHKIVEAVRHRYFFYQENESKKLRFMFNLP
jgi:hypothetical protein